MCERHSCNPAAIQQPLEELSEGVSGSREGGGAGGGESCRLLSDDEWPVLEALVGVQDVGAEWVHTRSGAPTSLSPQSVTPPPPDTTSSDVQRDFLQQPLEAEAEEQTEEEAQEQEEEEEEEEEDEDEVLRRMVMGGLEAEALGTQFTCFTGTKVQILTQKRCAGRA